MQITYHDNFMVVGTGLYQQIIPYTNREQFFNWLDRMLGYNNRFFNIKQEDAGIRIFLTPDGQEVIKRHLNALSTERDALEALVAGTAWQVFNPSEHGLTSCNIGLTDQKEFFWHERYAVEDAREVLLESDLFLQYGGQR